MANSLVTEQIPLKVESHVIFAFPDINAAGDRILSTIAEEIVEQDQVEFNRACIRIVNVRRSDGVKISLVLLTSLPTSLATQTDLAAAFAQLFASSTALVIPISLNVACKEEGIHVAVINAPPTAQGYGFPPLAARSPLNSHFLSSLISHLYFQPTVVTTLLVLPSKPDSHNMATANGENGLRELAFALEKVAAIKVDVDKMHASSVADMAEDRDTVDMMYI